MRIHWLLFALLLALCATLGAAFLVEEVPYVEDADGHKIRLGHGRPHPELATLLIGKPGAERHGSILWVGWVFGLLQIALFTCLLLFGSRKGGKSGPLRRPILAGGVGFAAVFSAVVWTYPAYVAEGGETLFLSFPVSSAWMLYGVWIFPAFFILLYIATFDRWTCTEDDLARFERLLASRASSDGDSG